MATKRYQLVIKGDVEFDADGRDNEILECLQSSDPQPKLEVALQELEETAKNITIDLIPN